MIFEGKTLEEVYQKASEHFKCSVSELDINIIQTPSKGLFGLFSRRAIIQVKVPETKKVESEIESQVEEKEEKLEKEKQEVVVEKKEKVKEEIQLEEKVEEVKVETEEEKIKEKKSDYFEYKIEELTIDEVVKIAKKEVNELFKLSCFNIDEIDVKVYDDETIIFIINGEDSALLIGKEGYRYNAISTMLFNWISQKYGYKVKLEIAEFLEQQREMMTKLLEPCMREIEERGRCKTNTFDGVLIYLALDILRSEFPHKYVAIKKNRDGTQYVIVNRFLNKDE